MGTQHAHRVVVKENISTEDIATRIQRGETQRVQKVRQIKSVACTNIHNSS